MYKTVYGFEVPQQPQYGPGKVVIYGSRQQDIVGNEMKNHPTYVAEFRGYYLFASHDAEKVPCFPIPPVAEFTMGEADYISSQLVGTCYVVLSEDASHCPKSSIIVKLSDWKKFQFTIDGVRAGSGESAQAQKREFFRALVTEVDNEPFFRAMCIHPETTRKMNVIRFNVGGWLKSTWRMSAGSIKEHTLENCFLKQEERDCSNAVPDAGYTSDARQLLMICHMHEFWRTKGMSKKDMAESLARLLPNDGHLKESAMSERLIDAAFQNPPASDLPHLFNKLRNEAKRDWNPQTPATSFQRPRRLCWLLSVALPVEFAAALQQGKSVVELANCKNVRRKYKFPV